MYTYYTRVYLTGNIIYTVYLSGDISLLYVHLFLLIYTLQVNRGILMAEIVRNSSE